MVIWRRLYEWIIGLPFSASAYTSWAPANGTPIVATLRARQMSAWKLSQEKERKLTARRAFCGGSPGLPRARSPIDRVIVAMEDRRGSMPVRELLALRLRGVVIEDSSSLMERLSGKVPLDGLNPSA